MQRERRFPCPLCGHGVVQRENEQGEWRTISSTAPYDLPPECGGGTLFSDAVRWAGWQPARWAVLGLVVAAVVTLVMACSEVAK